MNGEGNGESTAGQTCKSIPKSQHNNITHHVIFMIFQHQTIVSENVVIISNINIHMILKPNL